MDLIRRCQMGDEDAFAELFHQYKKLVYRTAYLLLGSAEEAEELLQEVFIQVHRSLSAFRPEKGAFTTWLYRITVNSCLSWRRRRHLLTTSLENVPPMALTKHPSFPERVENEDALGRALSQLSEKLRTVLILRYYLELSYAEIAHVLDIPLGTVKSRLDLALKTLQKALEKLAEDGVAPGAIGYREVAR